VTGGGSEPSEEEKRSGADGKVQKMMEKHEKKWKQKLVKIWEFNEQMEAKTLEGMEKSVGPMNFMPIMKLG
jgi:hypothetical protein